jgi:hypothetical protein
MLSSGTSLPPCFVWYAITYIAPIRIPKCGCCHDKPASNLGHAEWEIWRPHGLTWVGLGGWRLPSPLWVSTCLTHHRCLDRVDIRPEWLHSRSRHDREMGTKVAPKCGSQEDRECMPQGHHGFDLSALKEAQLRPSTHTLFLAAGVWTNFQGPYLQWVPHEGQPCRISGSFKGC